MSCFGDEDLNSVLLGSIPKHEDLFYLKGTISFADSSSANISNKAYQCQIFKCRCLIFSVPEVIASPVLGAVQHIHIVVSKEFYLSGSLQPHLEKIKIQVEEPVSLTNAVYEACLRYTVLARLAPTWNQVERYLVHGRDFLLSSAPLDAVKMDIVINEQDMFIVLLPLRLRLPQVCPQDFQISSFNSPFLWDLAIHNLTVHVLPSSNQANILTVSGHIPENSLFKSYKELKRHWKNSYGYRLPEHEDGMIYLTVKFGRWFSESLTYPIACVRARRPVFLRQREPQKVLLQLLADLHAKVPYVCGFPFGVDATIRYALPKLNTLAEAIFPCNLSEVRPNAKQNYVEDEEGTADVEVLSQPVSQYTQTQTCKPTSQSDYGAPFPCNLSAKPVDKKYCLRKEERTAVEENFSYPVSKYSQSQTQTSKLTSQLDYRTRSISPPPFLPQLSQRIIPTASKPAFVPIFTAKTRPSYDTASTSRWQQPLSSPPSSPTRSTEEPVRPMFGRALSKPIFGLAQPPPSPSPNFNINKVSKSSVKPKSTVHFPLFNHKPSSRPFNIGKGEKTPLNLPESVSKSSVKQKSTVHFPLFNHKPSSRPFNIGKGEKTPLNLPESGSKKVRNKPQVQQGVDVKALAHTKDGLSRVNTTTLIAYLRTEGVPCKVKDKKGELVAKVLTHLSLPLPSNLEDKGEQF